MNETKVVEVVREAKPEQTGGKIDMHSLKLKMSEDGSEPLYQRLQSSLQDQISTGKLTEGQRLPSVREISEELGLAYATVARAIRALVEEGVLDARTARGTVVAARSKQPQNGVTGILSYLPFKRLLHETRYYRSLLFLVQEGLVVRGQSVMYNHWSSEITLQETLKKLSPVGSLVVFGAGEERLDQLKELQRTGIPLICLGDTFFDVEVPAVHTTGMEDSMRVLRVLHQTGRKNIAVVYPSTRVLDLTMRERLAGVERMMAEVNGPHYSIVSAPAEEFAQRLTELTPRPDAILMLEGTPCVRALAAQLANTPLELGRNVALAVWDDNLWHAVSPLGIEYFNVEQPLHHIADVAVGELMRMLENPGYRARLGQVASQIVRVGVDGSREVVA